MTAALADPSTARPRDAVRSGLRVVVRPAPRREPPFDDELPEHPPAGRLDPQLPFDRPAPPPTLPTPGSRPAGLPDPARWARRLLVGLVESADGRRPLGQLSALVSPGIARGLGLEFDRAAECGVPPRLHRAAVLSVRASEPADGVAEACATVCVSGRVRAVALRLEAAGGRWRCVRLQLG